MLGLTPVSLDSAVRTGATAATMVVVMLLSGGCERSTSSPPVGPGDSGTALRPSPEAPKPWVAGVVVGDQHACAWTDAGEALCWGSNRFWQHGRAQRSGPCRPLQVPGLQGVIAMAAVGDYTCVIDGDRAVTCLGEHPARQIDETIDPYSTVPLRAPAAELAVARGYACARTIDGQVWCWGSGVAALPDRGRETIVPRVVPGLSGVTAIAAGDTLACAAVEGRAVHCWGSITDLRTERHDDERRFEPTPLMGLVGATALVISGTIPCALDQAGQPWCWAQQGTFGMTPSPSPLRMGGPPAVALRGSFDPRRGCTLAPADRGGAPYCWSLFEANPDESVPPEITLGIPERLESMAVLDLALTRNGRGSDSSLMGCMIGGDEQLRCWGGGGPLWTDELRALEERTWETESSIACEGFDTDGDGRSDREDRCPEEAEVYNTNADDDGCPDEPASLVRLDPRNQRIELLAPIEFRSGRYEVAPKSIPVVDHLAALIQGNPQLAMLEIQAHSDIRNGPIYGHSPTERQARSVRDLLVARGVAAHRLISNGYGEDRPIASNETPEGRALNRRIEVVIREWAD